MQASYEEENDEFERLGLLLPAEIPDSTAEMSDNPSSNDSADDISEAELTDSDDSFDSNAMLRSDVILRSDVTPRSKFLSASEEELSDSYQMIPRSRRSDLCETDSSDKY